MKNIIYLPEILLAINEFYKNAIGKGAVISFFKTAIKFTLELYNG